MLGEQVRLAPDRAPDSCRHVCHDTGNILYKIPYTLTILCDKFIPVFGIWLTINNGTGTTHTAAAQGEARHHAQRAPRHRQHPPRQDQQDRPVCWAQM